jgi:hypothetical protein
MVGGNKQRDYITKEDVSSPTVSAETVMLTCVIDAVERIDVAIINVANVFVQAVVDDEEDRVIICNRGLLVDILESNGSYVSTNKGVQAMPERCLWNHGGSITVLQEIREEPVKARVQDQPI